jgi:formylglycine-generating enzyme required for sulfatase activity
MAKKAARKERPGGARKKAEKPTPARGKTAKAGPKNATLAGKRIAFTGKFEQLSRDEAEAQARSLGAIPVSTVNAETALVVAGPRAGSKLTAAKKHGVTVLDEAGWIALAGTGPGLAAPAAALAKPDIKKIQGLLKSKTADGVTLGLSLLESLGAMRADYEAVFTEAVKKAVSRIVNDWLQGGDATRAEYVRYHTAVLRPAFLAAWGRSIEPPKPLIDLVDIPAGSFTMGSPENEANDEEYENQVQVRITKPFRLARTVVTQGQWREVMSTEPWRYEGLNKDSCGDDFPAVRVSWDDAMLFCQTLTDLERETGRLTATQSYRLPTEAEWEYACRAGTTTAYSFGDDPSLLDEYGWYGENADGMLRAVAEKKPNPWGLFDMHGNVWEWCGDWYKAILAGGDDPVGPSAGSLRVFRGGHSGLPASYCRSASRDAVGPGLRVECHGFRVVVLR